MKQLVVLAALLAVTVAAAPSASTPLPQGYQPFENSSWSCTSTNGSTVKYVFGSGDGRWMTMHTMFGPGDLTMGAFDNNYHVDASGKWLATQTSSGATTFQGLSDGWRLTPDGATPYLAFVGTEQSGRGQVNARQTWILDADGSIKHVWATWNGHDWNEGSATTCIKVAK